MLRTCGGEVYFDDVEKEALKRVLWRMADFCGVRLVTYCVMGNYFHALIEVPKRESWLERFAGPAGEEMLLEHLQMLYIKTYVGLLRTEFSELRKLGMESLVQVKLEAIKKRFCDLSLYVKQVKERLSRWFNKRRERRGTRWMDRYKSVMVEVKDAQNEGVVRRGVTAEAARKTLAEKGKLSPEEMVRLRVRYFSDGLVLGSKDFVEAIFAENRDQFGPKRENGARRISESEQTMYSMRRLRLRALG